VRELEAVQALSGQDACRSILARAPQAAGGGFKFAFLDDGQRAYSWIVVIAPQIGASSGNAGLNEWEDRNGSSIPTLGRCGALRPSPASDLPIGDLTKACTPKQKALAFLKWKKSHS
jgi:hypothetical protein